jgi:hypothetical protein
MLQMLIRILKIEGLAGAFKGFTANMLNTFSMRMKFPPASVPTADPFRHQNSPTFSSTRSCELPLSVAFLSNPQIQLHYRIYQHPRSFSLVPSREP